MVALVAVCATARSDDPAGLGELAFPNSGAAAAQTRFLTGVKLLHNFEYPEARQAFQDCQRIDPEFALAYWGEAMCCNHPLWGEQELDAGRDILTRQAAASQRPRTPREEGLLKSVRVLFGMDGDAPQRAQEDSTDLDSKRDDSTAADGIADKSERDRRYLKALAELSERYPDDQEIACFHALALLGGCGGQRDTRVYMQAAGVLEDVYLRNRRHPGVLHYLIHCYDDPVHAPLGLRAARTYGAVAGNSAHARHMPAHIYLPLGMWDEMIAANQAAWQAGLDRLRRLELPRHDLDIHALHALQWLHYGYLQRGDAERAAELLETIADLHHRQPEPMNTWYFALMRAACLVDDSAWERTATGLAPQADALDGVELSAAVNHDFAVGLTAIRQDTTGAERALERMIARRTSAEARIEHAGHHHSSYFAGVYASSIRVARVVETQLEALILLADGESDRAVARLRDAVSAEERLPTGYGPPLPVKPSHELLGEVLLVLQRPAEAEPMFASALERAPRRSAALAGLAEAARRLGHTLIAARAARELEKIRAGRKPYRAWRDLPARH